MSLCYVYHRFELLLLDWVPEQNKDCLALRGVGRIKPPNLADMRCYMYFVIVMSQFRFP